MNSNVEYVGICGWLGVNVGSVQLPCYDTSLDSQAASTPTNELKDHNNGTKKICGEHQRHFTDMSYVIAKECVQLLAVPISLCFGKPFMPRLSCGR